MKSTFEIFEVSDTGFNSLVEWVESIAKDGDLWATEIAQRLIKQADLSDTNAVIGLGSAYTRDGRPHIYVFDDDEIEIVVYNEDGNEIDRRSNK